MEKTNFPLAPGNLMFLSYLDYHLSFHQNMNINFYCLILPIQNIDVGHIKGKISDPGLDRFGLVAISYTHGVGPSAHRDLT